MNINFDILRSNASLFEKTTSAATDRTIDKET